MHPVDHAVLLLAGCGRRMGDLTDHTPKCLLNIGGMPILERILQTLSSCGVLKVIMVVGYYSEKIKQYVDQHQCGLDIEYITNPDYLRTNTAYSLWLARDYLCSNCLIIEGDVLLDEEILRRILSSNGDGAVWAVIPVSEENNEGILLRGTVDGMASGLQLVKNPADRNAEYSYKCAGIQLLTHQLAQSFAVRLDEVISRGEHLNYADIVLGESMNGFSMALCSLEGLNWAEIDDPDDYRRAQRLFNNL